MVRQAQEANKKANDLVNHWEQQVTGTTSS